MSQKELHELIIYQNSYFEILTEFFLEATGSLPRDFASLDDFSKSVNQLPEKFKSNPKGFAESLKAYSKLEDNLTSLYTSKAANVFRAVMKIDANKLNLGGSSRFLKTHLNATRKSMLFSDMVLIPDPIMPWIERSRDEEKFQYVIPLQMAFFILHLSDLLGAEFDIPPFFVFPSFEKVLEDHDKQTQEESIKLVTDVFSYYIDDGIKDPEDIMEFANKYPDIYLQRVETSQLFVSPGGNPGESIGYALDNYKAEMRKWRTEDWCKEKFSYGDISIVTNAIFERIIPNYHLFENSDELRSHPFLCIEAQAHYYQLIANMKNKQVVSDPATSAILHSFTSTKLDFLANISDSQIIELRKTNENVAFRRELRDLVNSLPQTKIEDLGYVASEICSHIELSISKHKKQIENFNEKYNAKHKYSTLIGMGTLGVTMLPALSPLIGTLLPLGLASTVGKYVSDKIEENAERKQFSHSMMGVIALAKECK